MKNGNKLSFVGVIVIGVLISCGFVLAVIRESPVTHQSTQSGRAKIQLEPCKLPTVEGELKCGKYEVFEDRVAKSGRKIALNIIVVPSLNAKPLADPLFLLAGGPGQGATPSAGGAARGFLARIRKDRDLVFVDQRGTGKSNTLNCAWIDDPSDLQTFFGELMPIAKVRECRENLSKIANLVLYTTPIAMDDLDEVRVALGYDKINLAGTSYGTFAAQIYLRQHPDHVRAALLQGVATTSFKQPLPFAKGAQHALDRLFEDCAADEACHTAFPNIQKEFDAVLARFNNGLINVDITNTSTKQKETVRMVRGNFVERLRLLLYAPNSAAIVPFLIHRAFENDFDPYVTTVTRGAGGDSIARGMYFTVTCSEGVQFIDDGEINKETKGTFLGEYRVRSHIAACKEWPTAKLSRSYLEPVKSDKPVLMYSGDIDAATPPWYGAEAVKYLTNGRQLFIKNVGHAFGNSCLQDIASQFIETGNAKQVDATCTDAIRRPPFIFEMPKRNVP